MMNSWINIYKPKGISSAKAVAIVKKALKGSKVGHCGTLDVEAEGILPLAIGEATKLTQYLMDAKKTYVFTIQFGAQTDTADSAGKVIKTTNHLPLKEDCLNICPKFIGTISQTPPAFSALKVGGVRAYKLARNGETPILNSRQIEIYDLKLLDFTGQSGSTTATYIAECSKGTYVRTLAEDIALSLQSLGFVVELRRTKVGRFVEQDSINITELDGLDQETIQHILAAKSLKIETVLDDIPVIDITAEQAKQIKYGQKCFFDNINDISCVWMRYNGSLLAIGDIHNYCFKSSRVFNII